MASFRVTTGMTLNTYRYNLMKTTNQLVNAQDTVTSGRKFSSYADDPGGATQAFGLRRDLYRTSSYISNTTFTIQKFQTSWTAMGTVVDKLGLTAKDAIEVGLNEPTGSGIQPLGVVLQETAESMVQTLNLKYGDHYCFNGNDGLNAPFTWDEESGNLLYRGVNVNAEPGTEDYAKLVSMSGQNEQNFIDIGVGLEESAGTNDLIESTAFNNSISGIDFLGFGVDEDGDPLNLVSIVKQIGDIYAASDPNSGEIEPEDRETVERLFDKFNASLAASTSEYVELDAKQEYLLANESRLTESADLINEQIASIENEDPAAAILNLSWQQYVYNATLSIGTQLLGQSLIDYMR
ncbi:MAG: hypothetical protein R3Y07_04645 [Eubacteriales bacterium]